MVLTFSQLGISRLKKHFLMDEKSVKTFENSLCDDKGILMLIPHFCHVDALCLLPKFLGQSNVIHSLYRPLKNKDIDSAVKSARTRFGVKTIDRKKNGMVKTLNVLKRKETLAMLFDQNAGATGTKVQFMGIECSCTLLPDILHGKFRPEILFVYTKRLSFWKSSIEVERMNELTEGEMVINHANRWLEDKLRNDKELRESWLWLHRRWKPGVGKPMREMQ